VATLDDLSPDQRAVLQLLLKQGKSYVELAALLRIDPGAVRDRAIAALEGLGGDAISGGRRAQLTDWLLGQQSGAETEATLDYLEESTEGREWARSVAGELRAIDGAELPDVPDEPAADEDDDQRLPGFGPAGTGTPPRASRLGGALLLVGVVVVVAVVLVILLTGGSDDQSASTTTTPSTQSTAATTAQPTIERQINLRPPGGGDALGVANVIVQGDQRALAVQAQGLEPNTKSNAYAVWLTGGPSGAVRRLGFAPAVAKNGRLEGVAALPEDAADFKRLEISLESEAEPKRPSDVVLRGPF
jgi:hypothetical protein